MFVGLWEKAGTTQTQKDPDRLASRTNSGPLCSEVTNANFLLSSANQTHSQLNLSLRMRAYFSNL